MSSKSSACVLLFVSLIVINLAGCFYSFSGASVPPHLKTIAIPVIDDKSGQGEPGLRENFTNRLITRFNDDNTLTVAEKVNADALLECTIVSFTEDPVGVSAGKPGSGEQVTLRRVNMSVRVLYKDMVQKKTISERTYSNYADYDPTANLVQGRQDAIQTAVDRITEDILIGTVSNW